MRPRGIRQLFRFPSRTTRDIRTEVDEEFAFHVDMRTAELVRGGLTETDARAQALREFGDAAKGAEGCATEGKRVERQRRLSRLVGEIRQDVTYGLRLIVRSPAFTVVTVLTLGIAIGGNTAVFSMINALFFKPLPVVAPQELVRIYSGQSAMSWPNVEDIVRRNTVFSDVVAQRSGFVGLSTNEGPARLVAGFVSSNYFTALGSAAAVGRPFLPSDTRADLVVLSERLWRTRYGSDPTVVGRTLTLDGRAYEVIGVMPARFRGISVPAFVKEIWLPVDPAGRDQRLSRDRTATSFEVFGRLRPGTSEGDAAAAMHVLGAQLRNEHPDANRTFEAMEVFKADGLGVYRGVGRTLMPVFAFLALLTIVAGGVLLIGCANIAGLLLGRAAARRREIAMRVALGAGRGRIVRQLLTESLLLAGLGGAAGVVLAAWLTSGLSSIVGGLPLPMELDLQLDGRVLLYTLSLSCLTAVLFGLTPARRAARTDLVPALRDDASAAIRQRLRDALVIGQVTVCTMLLVCSALFVRSLMNVQQIDRGFDPAGVVLFNVTVSEARHLDDPDVQSLFIALYERVKQFPRVNSAGIATIVPLALWGREEYYVQLSDGSNPGRHHVMANRVSPGYFDTIRIPIVAGRDFTWQDRPGSPTVAIVNETAAKRFWGGNAVGKQIEGVEVVGVVADSKYWTLGETIEPTIYSPFRQKPFREMTLFVRTSAPGPTMKALRTELQRLGPDVNGDVRQMTDAVSIATMPARVGAIATGAFGAIAMLLAAIGTYGLVAFTVVQRTKEIGIRKAIGARTADVIRLILIGNLRKVGAGLALGLMAGGLVARAFSGFVVGISTFDPITLMGVSAIVLLASVIASIFPTLRAARVNAIVTLKAE
jgi:predicted permease